MVERLYEFDNSNNQMFEFDCSIKKPFIRVLIESEKFDGKLLEKKALTEHLQQLRILLYQLFQILLTGNSRAICFFLENYGSIFGVLLSDLDLIGDKKNEFPGYQEALDLLIVILLAEDA